MSNLILTDEPPPPPEATALGALNPRQLEAALSEIGTKLLQPEVTNEEIIGALRTSPALSRFADQLVRQAQENIALAASEQTQMAVEGAQIDRRHIDGLGGLKATIHPRYMNELCARYGPDWFRDAKMLEDTLRRHPEMRATSTSGHTRIAVDGLKQSKKEELRIKKGGEETAAASSFLIHNSSFSSISGGSEGGESEPRTASCGSDVLPDSSAHAVATPPENTSKEELRIKKDEVAAAGKDELRIKKEEVAAGGGKSAASPPDRVAVGDGVGAQRPLLNSSFLLPTSPTSPQ